MNLSREQIENEPAGKQLDAWIAEHVFGLAVAEAPDLLQFGNNKFIEVVGHWMIGEPAPEEWQSIYSYSTDLIESWKVVETFKGWSIMKVNNGGFASVVVNPDIMKEWAAIGRADTVPLAICRAALLSKL
jgi:hypothetical protein